MAKSNKKYEFLVSFGGKVNASLGSSVNKVNSQFNTMQNLAKKVTASIGTAFAAVKIKDFVKDSVNTYKIYEQSMAQTASTAGIQKGTQDYEKLNKAARDAGKATSKTAAEAADALGYMSLAGWNVNQSTAALMPVLRLSEATQADLATTSDLVTDSMSALGISMDSKGKNLTRYLDVIVAANNKSNQTAMQVMEAYIGVGGTFENLGTPIEESAALLGVLANRGTKASEAGTSMNSILINLKKKSGESAKAMKALGLNAYNSEGKFKGVTNVLKELDEKLKGLATQEEREMYKDMIAGKTQVDTLNKLLQGLNTFTDDGVTELEALQKQLKNSDGALNTMADTVSNTMGMAFSRLSSATDDFKIEFISHFENSITPTIDKLANKITAITPKMGELLEKVKGKFASIKDTAKNTVAGFMTLMNMDTSFLGIQFNDARAKEVISDITGMTESQIDSLTATFQKIKQDFLTTIDTVKNVINSIKNTVVKVASFIVSHLDTIVPVAVKIGKVFVALKVVSKVIPIFVKVVSVIAKIVKIAGKIGSVIAKIGSIVMKVLPIIKTAFTALSGPVGIAIAVIGGLIVAGVALYKNWNMIKQKASEIWTSVKTSFTNMKDTVIAKVTEIWTRVTTTFTNMKNAVVAKVSEIWTGVKTAFINMKNSIITTATEIWNNVKTIFTNMKDSVISKASEIWTAIKTIFGNIKDSIAGAFTGAVNTAISGLNTLIDKVNSIHINIPSWIPGVGGKDIGLNIPQVPALASGGIVTKPTLAMIGEGNESEAVFPLSKLEEFLTNYGVGNTTTENSGMVFQIEYKPQIILQGNADKTEIKQEIEKAEANAQRDFKEQMKQWIKEQKRYGFI